MIFKKTYTKRVYRDLKTNESYNIHIDEVNSEWKSLDCFIKHTKFDVPYYINENGVKTTTGVYKKSGIN